MDRSIVRKPAYLMNSKFRDHSITANDQETKAKLKKLILLMILHHRTNDILFPILVLRLRRLMYARVPKIVHSINLVTIDNFGCGSYYKGIFGFTRIHLHKLVRYLQLPLHIRLVNGSVVTGEYVLLYGLYRYKSADDMLKHLPSFGRDPSQLTRVFQWFNTFIINRWGYKLQNNLEYWQPFFPQFADAIRLKVMQKSNNTLVYPVNTFDIISFIDCVVSQTSRVGTGPDYNGNRDMTDEQRAFYNGWKKHHGIKYQAVESPCGMCMDLYGPMSFRRHDLDLVTNSRINARLAELQEGVERQFKIYGDRIFMFESHIQRAHMGDEQYLTQLELRENFVMPKVRIAVEWDFGFTSKVFKFTQTWNNVKLKKHPNHKMFYFVATFLRNLHISCYGGITSKYFKCKAPSLEHYLSN